MRIEQQISETQLALAKARQEVVDLEKKLAELQSQMYAREIDHEEVDSSENP